MDDFIKNFANQFDETEVEEFTPETRFRDLDEWSSLTGLAIMNMIKKKYAKNLTILDLRKAETISNLYDIVNGK